MAKVPYIQETSLANDMPVEVAKSQTIRFLDVALYGPVMILSAMNKNPPELMRLALFGIGVGTMIYNLNNYMETRRILNETNRKRGNN